MPPEADDLGIDPAVEVRLAFVMSQLDRPDFTRFDPPEGLWDRIAASIAAEAPMPPTKPGSVVAYSINADDIVVTVAEDWAAFARDNDAAELVELEPNRTLWSYFESDEVRDLWRLLIEQVRAKQTTAHVPLRCDAPRLRRWFEMTITPASNGIVHFRSVLVFEQPRTTVALLGTHTARNSEAPAVPVCSWCGKGHDGTEWLEIEELVHRLRLLETVMPLISYGICPPCRDLMSADLLEVGKPRDAHG
jgi:hypothetical protein